MALRLCAFIILLLSSVTVLHARTIQGTVLSASDSTAIEGADCKLMYEDKLISSASTDISGYFSLETDTKSPVNLIISKSGFSSTDIIIESGSKNRNVGTVYLDNIVTLDEYTVTAEQVIQSNGRTIVYPSSSDVKASASSLSLFQKLPLPGLEANPVNRSLSVDGGNPVILINGVPSSIEDVNALQPKDIEKIEYSRFTPARYLDKGKSGFINIKLKARNDGGLVYLWGRSALNTAFVDANLKASYHQGPSQFSLFYNPSWRNYQDVYDNITESYIGKDFRVDLEKHDRNPFNYHQHQMRLKYDYSPNVKTLLSATFTATPNSDGRRSIDHIFDSTIGEYDNFNRSSSKSFSPSLDLFLRHDFNDKNTLEIQVVGTLSSSDYRRDNNYFYPDGQEDSYIMNVDSRRRSLISEINYIHNFSSGTQISAGYQNTVSHSTNTYLNSDYKPTLTENNNYAYVRLGQTFGKVYLSLSSGAKLFWMNNDLNHRHFFRNISSIQASWSINNKWNMQALFRYTPSIPSLTALTDYPQQVSPYLLTNGNPDLKVAENFLSNLSFSYNYKNFNASFVSAYVKVNNSVISDVTYLGDATFLSRSVNTRYIQVFSNGLWITIRNIYGFGARLSLSQNNYWTAGEDWKHNLSSLGASISLWWNKGPFTISYWRKLPSKFLNGQSVSKEENGDALQFDYKPNSHWTLGASWMYMFDRKGTRYPEWNYSAVNPYYRDRYIKNNANMIVLSVSYNADFGSIFRTANRNLNNSDSGSSLLKL